MKTKDATLEIPFETVVKPEPTSDTSHSTATLSREKVLKETISYFKGDELAANVWINKYALKDSNGELHELTPDDMHSRMAKELARIEKKYPHPLSQEEIFSLLKDFKYLVPQGGSMAGIGNSNQVGSLSNCFVIGQEGPADSYGAILKNDEEQVQLMKRRGGVGQDLSKLRPHGTPVKNSALSSTGVAAFMERYSNSTREVAQDGRRGALMLTISIKHPDAERFIDAKTDGTKVTGANVSVRIDDKFMQAVVDGQTYTQKFPVNSDNPSLSSEVNAAKLWNKIVFNAWQSAEPGILFWDTVTKESVADCYSNSGFGTISTNPCGEIPLCPYDSCRLLAVNLFSYVKHPFTTKSKFDFKMFQSHVAKAQRLMDDIVDLEMEKIDLILEKIDLDPEAENIKSTEIELWQKIRKKCVEGRRTGLGITAEGDMLAALGIGYGTKKAIDFSTKLHRTLTLTAYGCSVTMAKERGAFPVYNASKELLNPFIARIKGADESLYQEMVKHGRRNIALLTIAPTGTTTLMTQTTSGIEPAFRISYTRRRKINPNDKGARVDFVDAVGDSWEEYRVFHHHFTTWLKVQGYNIQEVESMNDSQLEKIIAKSPYHKATANDVDWLSKVKMQGNIQAWVDHAISVSVNVPENVAPELIGKIYTTAWEGGCKGITVYREGSRSGVLVSRSAQGIKGTNYSDFAETTAPKRPKSLEANLLRINNNDEKWLAVIGMLEGRPYEIFTGKAEDSFSFPSYVSEGWVIKNREEDGTGRYDFQYKDRDGYKVTIQGLSRAFDKEFWNYAKLISGVLRHGMPIQFVVELIDNLHLDAESLNTWKNGVVRALTKYVPDGSQPINNACPECDQPTLVYEEGCLNCKNCGFSKCG